MTHKDGAQRTEARMHGLDQWKPFETPPERDDVLVVHKGSDGREIALMRKAMVTKVYCRTAHVGREVAIGIAAAAVERRQTGEVPVTTASTMTVFAKRPLIIDANPGLCAASAARMEGLTRNTAAEITVADVPILYEDDNELLFSMKTARKARPTAQCEPAWERIASAEPDLIMICPNTTAFYIGTNPRELELRIALRTKAQALGAAIVLFDTDDSEFRNDLKIELTPDGKALAMQWRSAHEFARWTGQRATPRRWGAQPRHRT